MVRRIGLACILAISILCFVTPGRAVIKATTPLKVFLEDSGVIVLARIDKFYPEKPALVLEVREDLKGKAVYRRLPVSVKVDKTAEKENYIPPILKRLAPEQDVILFVKERGKLAIVYAFTNGSWFHMLGQKVEDGYSWRLISGEPYLRQTFKGTSAELRQLVVDYLAGKRKAPEPDEKEMPGFGPEATTSRGGTLRNVNGPVFAVIPTLGVGAPLAILAVLFPTLFGGVLVLFRQWLAFITVLSVNSTLYLLYLWQGALLRGTWWGTEAGVWCVLTGVAFLGTVWAWGRQVYNLSLGSAAIETPRRTETIVLWVLTLLCGGAAVFMAVFSDRFDIADYLLFAFAFGIVVGTAVHLMNGWFFALSMNPGRSTEGVILSAILFAHLVLAMLRWGGDGASGTVEAGTGSGPRVAELVGQRWEFQSPDSGLFVSAPLVDEGRIYEAAAHPGFKICTLYCLDRSSGKKIWEFIGDGELKNMISSPCLADGRLYIGEGFHDDPNCKLWCLDAATGALLWHFATKGQTESSPTVAAGKVYVGAGNDGLYCLDAVTGKELWRFPEPGYQGRLLRFGGGPTVVGERVYVGTGVDRNKVSTDAGETACFCLDANTGRLIWKAATRLPAWGAPVVSKGQVFLGIGNGDIFDDAKETSLGAMLCLDAQTGSEVWEHSLGNGVLGSPAVDDMSVYLGSRSGHVYCLDRIEGRRRWKADLGSPVVCSPALAQWCGQTQSVFAVATKGKVCCLDPRTGAVQWTYNLTGRRAFLPATPRVVVSRTAEGERRQIYFGAGIGDVVSGRPVLYCLEDRIRD